MGNLNLTWWNLQNFFDTTDDPISKDFEYTSEHGWTDEVFQRKKENLADALMMTHDGTAPDILIVCEIEKDALMEELLETMGASNLKVAQDESGTSDLRGIDVAIAYNQSKLTLLDQQSHLVNLRYRTRDIFEVVLELTDTGEKLVVFGTHWPSRRTGKYQSEPLRIATAEHISHLIENHVKVDPNEYEKYRSREDIDSIRKQWETNVLLVGDFNDEPGDRSVIDHLRATNDRDRVIGRTNDIDRFKEETADYRAQEVFLYNPCWQFLSKQRTGTYFIDWLRNVGPVANRYQVIDQLIVSRGLLDDNTLSLDENSIQIVQDQMVATESGRPRPFDKKKSSGYSDHLPLTATFSY